MERFLIPLDATHVSTSTRATTSRWRWGGNTWTSSSCLLHRKRMRFFTVRLQSGEEPGGFLQAAQARDEPLASLASLASVAGVLIKILGKKSESFKKRTMCVPAKCLKMDRARRSQWERAATAPSHSDSDMLVTEQTEPCYSYSVLIAGTVLVLVLVYIVNMYTFELFYFSLVKEVRWNLGGYVSHWEKCFVFFHFTFHVNIFGSYLACFGLMFFMFSDSLWAAGWLIMESHCVTFKFPLLEAGKTDEQNSAIGNVADPISVQAWQFFTVLSLLYPVKGKTRLMKATNSQWNEEKMLENTELFANDDKKTILQFLKRFEPFFVMILLCSRTIKHNLPPWTSPDGRQEKKKLNLKKDT